MKDVSKRQPDQPGALSPTDPSPLDIPSDAVAHVAAARRWAIGHGRPLSTPALAAILGAKASLSDAIDHWTADAVGELLWAGIVTWCQGHEVGCPERVAETMWSYLSFLASENLLAPGSDALPQLRAPLIAICGLNRDGRERARSRREPGGKVPPKRSGTRLAPIVPLRRSMAR